jgi:TRAP-type C4-dicarboxylate transport system permease small subunit
MNAVDKLFRAISHVFGIVALVFLLFLMVAITLDATVRSLADRPISGIYEMSEIALVIIVFLGLGWTQMDDGHIRVTALTKLAPPGLARVMNGTAWLAACAALLLLAWPSTLDAIHSYSIREFRWGHVQLPIWWAKILLAVGLWFGAAQMALHSVMAFASPQAEQPSATALGLGAEDPAHG